MKGSSRRTPVRSAYGLLLVTLCAGAAAPPPDNAHALRAASAVLRLIPGDDIEHGFRPVAVRVVDLDADGTSEVIYLHTSTYTGGSFEQHNGLAVMTALAPDDHRGQSPYPGRSAVEDQDYADIRASGYANDASAKIPGVLKGLVVKGTAIQVTFESLGDSSFCFARAREKSGDEPCPPPGTHTWTYRWTPSRLIRTDPPLGFGETRAGSTTATPAAAPSPPPQSQQQGVRAVQGFSLPISTYLSLEAQASVRSAVINGDPTAKMDNATVLKQLDALRQGADAWAHAEIAELRRRYPVELHHETWNGVPVVRVQPRSAPADPTQRRLLIELHGGAFVFGRAHSLGLLEAIPLAALSGITVVAVDYRQGPEHQFPAASEDVASVYRAALQRMPARHTGYSAARPVAC